MKKILQKNRTSDLQKKIRKKMAHSEENCKKKMQDVADGKAQLHDEFPELQDNQRSTSTAILTNPAVVIGLHFEHMWFVNNQNVLYQGHVLSLKCSKRSNILLPTGNTMKIRMKEKTLL